MKISSLRYLLLLLLLTRGGVSYAEDITNLGGSLTTDLPGRFALQLPAPNVSSEDRRLLQLSGFSIFHKLFRRVDGLGPSFVNRSCGGCHVDNGRGSIGFPRNRFEGSPMIIKLASKALAPDGSAQPVPGLGFQLQNHNLSKGERFAIRLRWEKVSGAYPDGTRYSLRRPELSFSAGGYTHRTVRHSLRMSPMLVGSGLLEAIPEEAILERADPKDVDGDGISGRANLVLDRSSGLQRSGRFGFKAAHPTLAQQSAAALFFDIGVTTDLFPKRGRASELDAETLNRLVVYQGIAGVPRARSQELPAVQEGKSLFVSIGCEDCHRMTFQTRSTTQPELDGQTIHPFTDLLLHDMGTELADNKPESLAAGREWRTTPLWGLGFSSTVSGVRPRFLHDGRARTIEEAILWHGGEGATSRDNFKALPKSEREKVLAFLNSL